MSLVAWLVGMEAVKKPYKDMNSIIRASAWCLASPKRAIVSLVAIGVIAYMVTPIVVSIVSVTLKIAFVMAVLAAFIWVITKLYKPKV